ncbi:MAG: threonylcarbamoyl-AMP synthase [Nitrospirota bacterium]|nr:MAG: threonylcarbamoyl-AMP synthase [Nitrospirota bacterium]
MAKVLPFPDVPSQDTTAEVTRCIQQDGVISVATESFFALAAGVEHGAAIQRVVSMKKDRQAKPILVLIGERAQLIPLLSRIPPGAEVLIDRFWPGPLTLVLPAASHLPDALTGGTGTIGVRQPLTSRLLALLRSTGPLTGTSANRSGETPLQHPREVEEIFGKDLDLILDSGPSPGGKPSTVLNLVGEIRLLRAGPISTQAIQEVLSTVGLTLVESRE